MIPLAFLHPWLLASLALLPALYYLLRVTPPPPRRVVFPAARLLAGLVSDSRAAARTPWWILLLRLAIAALVILGIVGPVLHPTAILQGSGPVRIVVDNGWAAARNWAAMTQAAGDLAAQAARQGRPLYILPTAPEPGLAKPVEQGPLPGGAALAVLRGLKPRPWPSEYGAAEDGLKTGLHGVSSVFLSTGTEDASDARSLLNRLAAQGEVAVMLPPPARPPLLLRPLAEPGKAAIAVDAPAGTGAAFPASAAALDARGHTLDVAETIIDPQALPAKLTFTLPGVANKIARYRIAGAGAGGVWLTDDGGERRLIGIAAAAGGGQTTPLADAGYYIARALAPFHDIRRASLDDLLRAKAAPAVIVLPDTGILPPAQLNALDAWVRQGGLLLRFAGPELAKAPAVLTPVPLRSGERALNGAMTWTKPLHLLPFPKTSPFFGLDAPAEVTVRQQVLAEPGEGLDGKTWAALEDGTPLVTAAPLGGGMLVLVHTTATPAWSDLALSGAFVQMLRRVVALAGHAAQAAPEDGWTLQPQAVLDGFGALTAPDASVKPIPAKAFTSQAIDSRHPPGLYGRAGQGRALNLGDRLQAVEPFDATPAGARRFIYGMAAERDLGPVLLTAAFVLFLLDWLVMIGLQTGYRLRRFGAVTLLALCLLPGAGQAATGPAEYAGHIYLAYIKSGDAALDDEARSGLQALVKVLNDRTSVEPAGVAALDPARDELAFFPFIYWPVRAETPGPSPEALRRVQDYLDHGGTILFDTGDHATAGDDTAPSRLALQRIAGGLDIPSLIPLPRDHVLTHTFYILHGLPGWYDGGSVWIEDQSASGRDNVSSVILGGNDWAKAWADPTEGERQEQALRVGVNLVMYALTGNYKADQIHLQQIMQRMGE